MPVCVAENGTFKDQQPLSRSQRLRCHSTQLVELSMWVLLGDRDIDRLGLVKVSQSMKMKTALSKISNH